MPHRPACILGNYTRVLSATVCKLADDLEALETQVKDGYVDSDTIHDAGRVIALLDVAHDELLRLAEYEHSKHPEEQCDESEEQATLGGAAN